MTRPFQLFLCLLVLSTGALAQPPSRPRARDLGLRVGILPAGPLDAITDVEGVRVGHTTVIQGETVRTGVTTVLPHAGNIFREKVAGAVFFGNGFGKLMGSTQVDELGEIETPIVLTSTLAVPRAADALLDFTLSLPGNEDVRSVNPLVAETNDGYLNDIRGRHITTADVLSAIRSAAPGPVQEGAVGAGAGTVAFGFKGGIGTASRRLPASLGGYTVGVLVQSNFGGVLTINGAPVGRELGRYYLNEELRGATPGAPARQPSADWGEGALGRDDPNGSIVIVIATDAPLDARNLRRLAARGIMGLARTGAAGSNGSGDYVISFSTARRIFHGETAPQQRTLLPNDAMSPLFLAAIEATEEAIYNSLFRATSVTGNGHAVEALPIDRTMEILRKHDAVAPKP